MLWRIEKAEYKGRFIYFFQGHKGLEGPKGEVGATGSKVISCMITQCDLTALFRSDSSAYRLLPPPLNYLLEKNSINKLLAE